MKANEFIKKHGLDYAKERLDYCKNARLVGMEIDLKRLVESHDLVEKHGGLISARKYMKFLQSSVDIGLYHGLDDVDYKTEIPLIEQAISDVESCQ